MARALRIEYEGAFYHVTSLGNERKRIFFAKSDYQKFKSYLEEAEKKFGYHLHSYVLMSNHYHLLIETPQANLSKLMHYINAVAKIKKRFSDKQDTDSSLRKRIEKMEKKVSNVKG